MKLIKIYLAIVTVLLIVGLGFGVYVWYTVQKISLQAGNAAVEVQEQSVKAEKSGESTIPGAAVSPSVAPVTVKTTDLTASQQQILKSFGFNADTFTITPAMVTCAEDSVGKVRLDEILKGAAPTPFESIKLLPCFK
jgi:hypothetical protein